jgi:dTDP-4-amino-4,6-dideoxygalactose transaminase
MPDLNNMLRQVSALALQGAKSVARGTIGRLPPPASRLTGRLAIDGGAPVRDVRWRPWASSRTNSLKEWLTGTGPQFRKVFLSGSEGLPQKVANEFAQRWAEYCGCRYGLLTPHGTDALRVALAAAFDHDGLEYGGEVIVPNLSFIASATAALDRRFGVVLADVDAETLLLDPAQVELAVEPGKTRAIMVVHQFGQPADMTALRQTADRHGLKIIEDAAQAHGAEWETGRVGALGDVAGFSFQSAKNLTAGEGGALTTNDRELFERASSICNVGRSAEGGSRWVHPNLGWNIRASEYQAALLCRRLDLFEEQQGRRAANFALLRELLAGARAFKPLALPPGVRKHGMYMFVLRYCAEHCADTPLEQVLRAINAEGIPLYRLYEATIAQQPAIEKIAARRPQYVRALPTPVADAAVRNIVYLPHHIFLGTAEDMRDIARAIGKVEAHMRQRGTARE